MTALEAARAYTALGWRVVPVPLRAKKPALPDGTALPGWQALRLDAAMVKRYFFAPCNLGVLLGEVSGGLVDVDLDTPEAVELAPRFLLPTWTFGRASTPRSHWLFVARGATYEAFAHAGVTLLELRSHGKDGKAHQTIFPPSLHASGERVGWTEDLNAAELPTAIDAEELRDRVASLAAAALVARHVPRDAVLAMLDRGQPPPLPVEVARAWRAWWRLAAAPKAAPRRSSCSTGELDEAVRRYNADHGRRLPRSGGTCPVCGHRDCFGMLPDTPDRWCCFSASHAGAGIPGNGCHTGDMLDLDAHAAGVRRVELLRREGYLTEGGRPWARLSA